MTQIQCHEGQNKRQVTTSGKLENRVLLSTKYTQQTKNLLHERRNDHRKQNL